MAFWVLKSPSYNSDLVFTRIYQHRHTPQKENGDTVLKVSGKSDILIDFNTLIVC